MTSKFDIFAPRIVASMMEGFALTEACRAVGVSPDTARKWVAKGRREPESAHGVWVAEVEAARTRPAPDHESYEPGPVERRVDELVATRDLDEDGRLVAAQARACARSVDRLAAAKGGAAAMGLASVSRRLEELVGQLRVAKKDWVDDLREQVASQRAQAQGPIKKTETGG